jgi:hypothetical protein
MTRKHLVQKLQMQTKLAKAVVVVGTLRREYGLTLMNERTGHVSVWVRAAQRSAFRAAFSADGGAT